MRTVHNPEDCEVGMAPRTFTIRKYEFTRELSAADGTPEVKLCDGGNLQRADVSFYVGQNEESPTPFADDEGMIHLFYEVSYRPAVLAFLAGAWARQVYFSAREQPSAGLRTPWLPVPDVDADELEKREMLIGERQPQAPGCVQGAPDSSIIEFESATVHFKMQSPKHPGEHLFREQPGIGSYVADPDQGHDHKRSLALYFYANEDLLCPPVYLKRFNRIEAFLPEEYLPTMLELLIGGKGYRAKYACDRTIQELTVTPSAGMDWELHAEGTVKPRTVTVRLTRA